MLEERFRLMYLSRQGLDIKEISLSRKTFTLTVTLACIGLISVIGMGIHVGNLIFQNYRIVSLENDRDLLQKDLLLMKERVSNLDVQLSDVQLTGNELRNAASLPPIDADVRELGVGGPVTHRALDLEFYPDEIGKTASELHLDLEKLDQSVKLEKSSILEVADRMAIQKELLSHFPSIMPILGGKVGDDYGYRIDPYTDRTAFHKGVDIPMPLGTPVHAAAGGTVIVANNHYTPHYGYGQDIVIDHGYGFQTHYGHLSKVLVQRGQKVRRWDIIGEVGDTGKSVGYHLHYEVISDGQMLNPEHFIYNN
jgi:murein DD-endopeptidase MepM/ murein hydrolase activator NlpD